jgi:crossover junction endodeoxyribonuclease RuvC
MFEPSRVLGVDPGVATVGLAVLERGPSGARLVWAGTVRTPARAEEASRLRAIHGAVAGAIAEHRPGSVAVERVAWNRNQVSALPVARATGVILLAASEAGLPVEEYGPLEVKMAVTGIGGADKAQVRSALSRLHGLRGVPAQPDAADAAAVALCHLQQSRMRRVSRLAR